MATASVCPEVRLGRKREHHTETTEITERFACGEWCTVYSTFTILLSNLAFASARDF